jgi:hypothetical protein
LVNLGLIRNLKIARNMIKGGYVCVNFSVTYTVTLCLKPADIIWVLKSPWSTYLIENSEDSIYENLYNLIHYTDVINSLKIKNILPMPQKPMHSINSYFYFLSVFSSDLAFINLNSTHSPQKPFQNLKTIDSFINNKFFW